MFKNENQKYIQLIQKHFCRNNKDKTAESLMFYCLCKVAREVDPESFYDMNNNLSNKDAVEYFHKSFRQVDVYCTDGLDNAFYNCIALFKDYDWELFNQWTTELMEYNTIN